MSDERPTSAAAARMPADLTGRDSGRTLAGLIDVLDRADGGTPWRRPLPRHAAAARAAAYRSGAARTVPLRSVRPAPPARPAPAPFRALPQAPTPSVAAASTSAGLLARLTRRVALWGAGPDGAYLAWHSSTPAAGRARPVAAAPVAASRPGAGAPGLLAALRRRAALWGAGPHGEHLAWSTTPLPRAAVRISLRDVDGPVVLRELPSTPTVKPATPSPVVALVPGPAPSPAESEAPPAQIGHRPPAPPVAESEPAGPRVPVPSARTPQPTGWPHRPPRSSSRPARSFPTATGLARARGDPVPGRARGSPRPPPCRALRAPG
jgi:hypothetical protein